MPKITDTKRMLDPCKQYTAFETEVLSQACGVLPTHVDENHPDSILDQVCLALQATASNHLLKEDLNMGVDGALESDNHAMFYPIAVIGRVIDGYLQALFIHNGGQMIVRMDDAEGTKFYSFVVGN